MTEVRSKRKTTWLLEVGLDQAGDLLNSLLLNLSLSVLRLGRLGCRDRLGSGVLERDHLLDRLGDVFGAWCFLLHDGLTLRLVLLVFSAEVTADVPDGKSEGHADPANTNGDNLRDGHDGGRSGLGHVGRLNRLNRLGWLVDGRDRSGLVSRHGLRKVGVAVDARVDIVAVIILGSLAVLVLAFLLPLVLALVLGVALSLLSGGFVRLALLALEIEAVQAPLLLEDLAFLLLFLLAGIGEGFLDPGGDVLLLLLVNLLEALFLGELVGELLDLGGVLSGILGGLALLVLGLLGLGDLLCLEGDTFSLLLLGDLALLGFMLGGSLNGIGLRHGVLDPSVDFFLGGGGRDRFRSRLGRLDDAGPAVVHSLGGAGTAVVRSLDGAGTAAGHSLDDLGRTRWLVAGVDGAKDGAGRDDTSSETHFEVCFGGMGAVGVSVRVSEVEVGRFRVWMRER